MSNPLEDPDDDWWNSPVNRREIIWLGIAGAWSLGIFTWMAGFTQFGDQNPIGTTYDVDPDRYQERVGEYKEAAEETENGLVPPDSDVYVGAMRFNWDGLPTVLEAGREYDIHLGAYDVQHGFSVRPEENLNKQINLQVFPGSEWVIPMTFDEPGTYHVVCNGSADRATERCTAASRWWRDSMSAVASLFRNDYDAEGFRTCSVTGLDIHRSVENYVKLFGLTAVIALAVGGSFAFSVAMTRWEFIGLLDPSSYYTHLSIHAWNLLIFWMVFMEIAVLYVGGPMVLGRALPLRRLATVGWGTMVAGAIGVNASIWLSERRTRPRF